MKLTLSRITAFIFGKFVFTNVLKPKNCFMSELFLKSSIDPFNILGLLSIFIPAYNACLEVRSTLQSYTKPSVVVNEYFVIRPLIHP